MDRDRRYENFPISYRSGPSIGDHFRDSLCSWTADFHVRLVADRRMLERPVESGAESHARPAPHSDVGLAVPMIVIGSTIGKRLFEIAPAAWFKKVTYGLLLVTGVSALAL